MHGGSVRGSSRTRWLARRWAAVTTVSLVLSVGMPVGALPAGDRFPLGWLWSWLRQAPASASAFLGVPVQLAGKPKPGDHYVSADATRASGGAGRPSTPTPGALPADVRPRPDVKPGTTPTRPGDHSFDPARSKRIPSAASATSDVYANLDSSYTRRVYQAPVNYRAADGTWRPIDQTLIRSADGRLRQRANSIDVSFGQTSADAGLATVGPDPGLSVSYSLVGAAAMAPVPAGDTAIYRGIFPDVEARLQAHPAGVRQSLVLRTAGTTSWLMRLRPQGLTPTVDPDGAVMFRDRAGVTRVTIPPGYADDSRFDPSAGGFTRTHAVTYQLTNIDGELALRIAVDSGWLRDSAREFPVTVTIAVEVDRPVDDTYVIAGGGVDRSAEGELLVGTRMGEKARALLSFGEVDRSFGAARLTSASLRVFNTWAADCAPRPVWVYPVTGSWKASTVTATTGPADRAAAIGWSRSAATSACAGTAGRTGEGSWMTFPLTTPATRDGSIPTGLALAGDDTDRGLWRFTAANSGPDTQPHLQVTFAANIPPQVDAQYPPSGHAAATLTPELLATGHDPDNAPKQSLDYYFIVYDKNAVTLAQSGWIASRSWTVPESVGLRWGETYLWTVLAGDGAAASSNQRTHVLTTVPPQPLVTSGLSQNGDDGFDPQIGNFTTSATDASVATAGPALTIQRSYNSLDPRRRKAAFGEGWSSLLDTKVVNPFACCGVTKHVVVRYPNGQEVTFGRNPDGTFTPPPGRFATLGEVNDGTATRYKLVDKDGTTYTFRDGITVPGEYVISSITDAAGRSLTFSYTFPNDLIVGVATTITSASGRKLNLTWSTSVANPNWPHVLSVSTDPTVPGDASTALTWSYTYDVNRLTKVCPPTSATACTTYSYNASVSQHSSTVLNAGPQSYWRFNEASGTTAVNSVLEHLGTQNAVYNNVALGQTGPLAGTSSTAAKFNGTTSYVQLPNQLQMTANHRSISLWFKINAGQHGVLYSYTREPITSATATGYVPALYVGTSGKLYGAFWPIPQIVSFASVANAQWHHVVLTVGGNSQNMYLDGSLVGSSSGTPSDFGQQHQYIGSGFLGGPWPDSPFTGTTPQVKAFDGSIAEVALFDRPLQADDVATMRAASSAVQPMTQAALPSGNTLSTLHTYDDTTGRIKQIVNRKGIWHLGAPTASGSAQVYAGAVLSAGPADYWRLAEAPQGITDAVNQVNGNVATYNAVTLGVPGGPLGDSTVGSFNPASLSHLGLPAADVPNTGPLSISMWFKTTAAGPLFGYEGGGGWVPALYVGMDGKLRGHFWINNISAIMTSAGIVTDGVWHHVALTTSGSSQSLYLDGARVGGPVNAALVSVFASQAWVGKARWEGGWPQHGSGQYGFFNGQIAEVAMWRSQLSDAQVSAQFAARANATGAPVKTVTVEEPSVKNHTYVYDLPGGRQIADIDTLGNKTQYGYDTGGFLRTVTDSNGNVTTTEHDVRGNTISSETCQDRSAGACSKVYFEYFPDATTKVLTPDPRNDVLLKTRDARSSSSTDNTYLTTNTYDVKGNRTAVTDPLGRVTATTYTDGTTVAAEDTGFAPPGLPASAVTPGGAAQSVFYLRSGDVARVVDPAGKTTTFTYDGLGRVLTRKETTSLFPAGLTTSFGYDGNGQVVSQTDPPVTNRVTGAVHTAVTTTVYDVDGLPTSQAVADTTGGDASRTTSWTYNTRGFAATETDATGKTTSFEYGINGQLTKQTDPDGGITNTTYDAEGQPLTTTRSGWTGDPNNPSPATDLVLEVKAYDPAGRLASVTDAMGWVTSHQYTDNGLTAKVTRKDPVSAATFVQEQNAYDAAGHPTAKVTNDGATTTSATYDAAGRVVSSTLDPAALKRTTAYEYTRDDHVAVSTQTDGAGAVLSRVGTVYDMLGRSMARTVHNALNPPVLRWRLTETSGTRVADTAGNAVGSASNVGWLADPTRGPVATFNGTSSKVEMAGAVVDTTRSFSVAGWVKLNSKAANQFVLALPGLAGSSAAKLSYQVGNDAWNLELGRRTPAGTTSWLDVTSPAGLPQTGVWTHLAGTVDTATGVVKLYVDGTERATATSTVPFNNPADTMKVGTEFTSGWLNGSLSDLQIYQHALSPTEVGQVKTGAAPAAGAGVVRTMWRRDTGGLVRTSTDPNGNLTDFAYDEAGRPAVTTRPAVQAETGGGSPVTTRPVSYVGYDTFGAPVESKDPNGNVTTTAYDAVGRPVSTTLPSYTPPGSSTPITPVASRTYDGLGQMLTATDPLGKTTSYTYDQLGRIAKVTTPNNGETKYTYDALGDLLSTTDPTGAVTTATYDYLGRKRTTTQVVRQDNANHTTNYAYAAGGWLSSIQQPTGVTTAYTYNAAGEQATVKDGANNTTTSTYDGAGRAVKTTLPDGTYNTTTYSLAGRPVSAKAYDAANTLLATQSRTHDHAGNVTGTTDARGTQRSFGYDADGRQIWQVEPTSATDTIVTGFGYDVAGNRTRFTDGRGNAFVTTYNTWNLPQSRIEPATTAYPAAADRTFTIGYDAAGRTVSLAAPGGVSVTNTYDSVGHLTAQVGAGASVPTTDRTFGYDLAGRMTSFSGPGGTNTLTHDDRSQLRSTAGPSGAATFTYTPDGAMASRADPAGTTTYGYDAAGRLSTVANPSAGVQLTAGYNSLSQPATITYGGTGNRRSLGYDQRHRLTSDELKTPGGTSIAKIAYGYDPNGNETSKTTTGFVGAAANTYTYDLADRLTSWSDGAATTVYAYDKSGNRVQAGSKLFTYDQRNQLQTANGAAHTYTPRGTLASAGGVATAADAFDQVVSQGVPGGPAQTYSYDALGRVIRAGFAYTGLGNHLAADGAATYTRDPAGSLLGEASGSSTRLAWTDLHTDVVGQFTATGTAFTGSTTYDPLGKVLATLGMVGNLGYQSEWTDAFTGRVNMLARWYNTDTGQFDTRDTADLSPTPDSVNANRFAYANNNPLTATDPTGHACFSPRCLVNSIKSAASTVKTAVTTAWNTATSWASDTWDSFEDTLRVGRDWIVDKAKKAGAAVAKKVEQGRKYVAKKANQVKQKVKQDLEKAKRTGMAVAARAARYVQQQVNAVKDAYKATEKWVKDHKAEIAGFLVGAVVGIGCGLAIGWTGVGAVACGALAGAAGSMVTGAMKGHTGWDLVKDGLIGAATGALMGGLFSVAGQAIGAGVRGLIGGVGLKGALGSAGRAIGNEVGDIAGGRITGGFVGGMLRGGATKAGGPRASTTDTIDAFRFGSRANPNELKPRLSSAPKHVQDDVRDRLRDPVWRADRAEDHAAGLVDDSPFISVALDPRRAASTTDLWLRQIAESAPDIAVLRPPTNRIADLNNPLSKRETEVLFEGEDLEQYLVEWIPNPFRKR